MFLDDLSAALVTSGVGQATNPAADWFIYLGYFQDQPDRAICIYEQGGEAPEELWAIDRPGAQVRVRGSADDYEAVRTKIKDVFLNLHAQEAAIGAAYVFFYAKHSAPISFGIDEKRRPSLAYNFRSMMNRDQTP